jgi:hypothetical protein
VEKINISIGQDPNSKSIIGVLDIYGFESFKCNRYSVTCVLYHYTLKSRHEVCALITLLPTPTLTNTTAKRKAKRENSAPRQTRLIGSVLTSVLLKQL